MTRLRTFLRRHILWVGFFAVVVPLVSILVLQYRSLAKLEKASTVAETVGMKNYLVDVSKEMKYFYKDNADELLKVHAHLVESGRLEEGRHYFNRCSMEGAKRLFVVAFNSQGDEPQMLFFSPHDSAKASAATASEERAVQVAAAPYRLLSKERTPLANNWLMEEGRDPENKILFRPITDDERRVLGVAGVILDSDYFKHEYMPRLIRKTLPRFFPDDAQENVIVTLYEGKKNLVFSTQPVRGQDDEIPIGLPYFYEYHLGIRSRHMTPAQWAHWNFNFNLTLSLMMTVVLVGGIALALRTASRAMRLSQMKTDFVSNVSHELRTPLSSIRVFGEFLKLGRVRDESKIQEYGEYIETESRRLTQLINNILDFSKIESDRKTYQFERANIGELVSTTLKTFDVQLRQQGFSVRFDAPQKPIPPVLVDTDSIAQVFMNLLDNAVKYSGASKEIRVRLEQTEGFARISVTDYGIGIPREEQPKIFEKFYRVSTGLVHDVKGSGLGLALVEHIVKAHRGRVTVESEPGRGSTFTIHLPVVETVPDRAGTPEKPTPLLTGGDPSLGRA